MVVGGLGFFLGGVGGGGGAAPPPAPLTVIGLLQFVAPILQFLTGWWIMHEPMPLERWIGFGLVWIALIVLSVDSLRHARRRET